MLELLGVERNQLFLKLLVDCRHMKFGISDLDAGLSMDLDGYPADFVSKLQIISNTGLPEMDSYIGSVGARVWRHPIAANETMIGIKLLSEGGAEFDILLRQLESDRLVQILKDYWTI